MKKELVDREDYLPSGEINTIYFGGGTPSVIDDDDIKSLLDIIFNQFDLDSNAEITLEANPDDISLERLINWKEAGINRLSIGIQSFFEEDLKWMNRAHNAEQAEQSVILAKQAGFENITADLIYGLPNKLWEKNVQKLISLGIPHVSCYALMVEEKTALHHFVVNKKVTLPSDEIFEKEYNYLCKALRDAGYAHYEISNFCKPGYQSIHNGSYWVGVPYLGIGPSAHSFDSEKRRWNISNNTLYAKNVMNNTVYYEDETLSIKDQYNEYVMTGLRTAKGIGLLDIQILFGDDYLKHLKQSMQGFSECGKLKLKRKTLTIPESEWFKADTIIADLFLV